MRLLGEPLKGEQSKQFYNALLRAFSLQRFDEMLLFQLDKHREHIALGDDFEAIVFRVIQRAEQESWTAELLQAARESRPDDVDLFVFAQQFGLATATPQGRALERKIREANSDLEVVPWRTRLSEIETQVCRIEIASGWPPDFGTGFLLGPDVVMTNYHVMEKVIQGQISPKNVTLRFDYKVMADGTTLNSGTTYRLAEQDWLIDYSKYSPLDSLVNTGEAVPLLDQLDYALLRVSGTPGDEPVGGDANKDHKAPARGWIKKPTNVHQFQPGTALFIMHHPDAAPLKLSLDTNAIIGINHNKTRVRYKTNTEGGSSGSPCFNANWELVALHHSGDPNYEKFHRPEYNQGIPFTTILDLLTQKGKIGELIGV